MFDGRLKIAGSTVLSLALKVTYCPTFWPATEPRTSVCRCRRRFIPSLMLCAPFNQLRLSTNCQVSIVRALPTSNVSGSVIVGAMIVGRDVSDVGMTKSNVK